MAFVELIDKVKVGLGGIEVTYKVRRGVAHGASTWRGADRNISSNWHLERGLGLWSGTGRVLEVRIEE